MMLELTMVLNRGVDSVASEEKTLDEGRAKVPGGVYNAHCVWWGVAVLEIRSRRCHLRACVCLYERAWEESLRELSGYKEL